MNEELDEVLIRQAAELHEAVRCGKPGANERMASWLTESRRHVRIMTKMLLLDHELANVDSDRRWDISTPLGGEAGNVVPLREQPRAPEPIHTRRRGLWRRAAAAAGPLIVAGTLWWGTRPADPHRYQTAIGEQRTFELADGSVVHLNTQSAIRVRFSEHGRDIQLLAGEALFKVHQEPARPFRVLTDDATIQALGTEFDVYRRSQETRVAVLAGKVRVVSEREMRSAPAASHAGAQDRSQKAPHGSVELVPGQQARIDWAGSIGIERMDDPATLTAWRERRLIFKSAPLSEVAAELNRYNEAPRFVMRGEAAARAFSGILNADDPASLAELLENEPGLRVERNGDDIVVRAEGPALSSRP